MTKVKICGLTTKAAVDTAVKYGADYLGFVFAKSHRQILPEKVKRLTTHLPKNIQKVGVFVSPSLLEVEAAIRIANLNLVQIHGTPLQKEASVPMIQALTGKKNQHYKISPPYRYLLLDAPPKKYMGGNGATFDWQSVKKNDLPKENLWIAGGLNSQNVRAAIDYFSPETVDVSSGVETHQKKDLDKIMQFIQIVKGK